MTEAELHYKKMTETPVEKLIMKLALPTVISMLISNIYNLADTFYVGHLGVSASGAVGIVFTLMAILQAIGFMLGHGSGSIVSRKLAEKDVESASCYSSTSFFLALASGLPFVLLGIPFVQPLMHLLGSTDTILPYASQYGLFILASAPMMIGSLVLNNILRYEGKAFYAMIGLTTGGILNIILDPICICIFKMGVAGAGFATALSQTVSFLLLLTMFRKHAQSKLHIRSFSRSPRLIADILTTGSPNLFRQGLNSISSGILNNAAGMFGDACVSAMAITGRCQFFMLSIAIGIGQGFQPVAGFNFQAHKYLRLRRAFRFTLVASLCVMLFFSIVGFSFAPFIVHIFQTDPEVVRIGGAALRFTSLSLFFMPFNITPNMLFQSAGQKGRALLLACLRSGLCFIPLLLILPNTIGILGVQTSQPLSDVISSIISLPFAVHFFRHLPKEDQHVAADD